MSDFEHDPIETEDARPDSAAPGEQPQFEPTQPRWKRVVKVVAITLVAIVALLVFAGFMLYNFGGMSGTVHPEVLAQYDQAVAAGQAAPIQKRFVIPIPGCKCHSTDPSLTAQHTRRHMNECGKCHNTRPAHMEPGIL